VDADDDPDRRDGDNDNPGLPHLPPVPVNRPGAQIFQFENLPQDCSPLLFQIGNIGCFLSTERITYAHQSASKKLPIPHFHVHVA